MASTGLDSMTLPRKINLFGVMVPAQATQTGAAAHPATQDQEKIALNFLVLVGVENGMILDATLEGGLSTSIQWPSTKLCVDCHSIHASQALGIPSLQPVELPPLVLLRQHLRHLRHQHLLLLLMVATKGVETAIKRVVGLVAAVRLARNSFARVIPFVVTLNGMMFVQKLQVSCAVVNRFDNAEIGKAVLWMQ